MGEWVGDERFCIWTSVGLPIGTILAEQYGFRAPFLLFALVALVSFFLVLSVLPQPPIKRSSERLSIRAAVKGYRELLRNRAVVSAGFAYATMLFAVSTFVVFFPTWLEKEIGVSPTATALLFMVGGLANLLFGPQAGSLSDRIGRKPVIVGSCLVSAVLFAVTPFVVFDVFSAYVVFFFTMMLLALRLSPLQALLTTLVPDARRGSLMSLVVAIGQIGGGLGGAIAGVVYSQVGYFGNAILSALAITATGVVILSNLSEPA
ncbi:MFS transporter [Scytonema sp. UIC 10036]|uniref:MFS transporter n=1 Tax=Scytonema sp. UIC 10036 TaxID=2304196 RepID=UPI00325C1BB3